MKTYDYYLKLSHEGSTACDIFEYHDQMGFKLIALPAN